MDSLRVDAIAYPTSRRRPVLVGEPQPGGTCGLSAHSGFPALSAPAGFTDDGLPVGIEFMGRPGADVRLVGLAYALEQLGVRRAAPSTTPRLRGGRGPSAIAFSQSVRRGAATGTVRFVFDPLTNVLRYDASVTGGRSEALQALVLRRPASGGVGSPVIHRLAGPAMREASGAFTLAGIDRRALAGGQLQLAIFTADGMGEVPLRAVVLP
jgi:hypothetical protein